MEKSNCREFDALRAEIAERNASRLSIGDIISAKFLELGMVDEKGRETDPKGWR
jgi:hypothetical protein